MTTTNDGVKLAYRVVGSGPRTVIAVHGWMTSSRVYDDLVAAIDPTGLRIIVPDLRGSGDSDKPATGYTIERYAQDILGLADDLGVGNFTLVGHSMGGAISQWIAAHAPGRVDGMLLLCPVPASGVPFPPEAAALFRNADNAGAHTAILGMACTNLSDAGREHLLAAAATVPTHCIAEAFDAWAGANFADKLSAVTARTLVVATDDPFLPPAFLRQTIVDPIAGARLAVLHGAGHYPLVERTGETAALVEGFLAGLG
jgi:pimeloyl-ACP methyl ester carboxylesterase